MMSVQRLVAQTPAPFRWLAALRRRVSEAAADLDERISLQPRALDLARWPLLRPLARRRAAALFDLCAGFVYAQVLAACVELDLFALLRAGDRSGAELAEALALPSDASHRLLEAGTALRLFRKRRNGRYSLGPLGAAVALDPGIAAMVAHHRRLYADLADPVRFLRQGGGATDLAAFWPYDAVGAPDSAIPYTRLMATSQSMVARQVLAAYDFRPHRRLLDVGGGDGSFLRHVASRYPHLALSLFDLDGVAPQAEAACKAAGIPITTVGGDFRRDSLPAGADLVSLVRVLHDHDDATVLDLLRKVRAALTADGTLLIAEPMADVPGTERVGNAYFPIYLMGMGRGRTRSVAELGTFLRQAGFAAVTHRSTPLPMIASVLVATGHLS